MGGVVSDWDVDLAGDGSSETRKNTRLSGIVVKDAVAGPRLRS